MSDRDTHGIYGIYRRVLTEAAEEQSSSSKKKVITPEQRDRLAVLKIKMEEKIPRFSKLIRLAPVIFTYDMPTMAVDNFDNLYINPEFFDRLSDDGVVAVLAHEMYHIDQGHPKDSKLRNLNNKIHNFATDYVINRDLMEYGIDIKNITKDPKKPVGALLPKKDNKTGKYYIRISGKAIDVTDMGVYELYNLLMRQEMDMRELLKQLEEQFGDNWDEEPIDSSEDQQEPPPKTPYQVGDIVVDVHSDIRGQVVKASEPDENGDQILDIDWDIGVVEKYITESIETGVHSSRIKREQPIVPPKKQKGGDDKEGQPGEGETPSDKPSNGKGDSKEEGEGNGKSTGGKGGKHKGPPKPAEGQDETPRSEPISDQEKEDIRREGEIAQRQYDAAVNPNKINIKGKGVVNWAQILGKLVRTASEERSIFLPDIRSIGAGRFIRGVERRKDDLSLTILVDTSGSVSQTMVNLFMREIVTIASRLPVKPTLNVILWHDKVYSGPELFGIKSNNYNKLLNITIKSGGTHFDTALKTYSAYQNEFKKDKAVIVFTDGDFNGRQDNDPNLLNTYIKPNIPVIFCLFQPSTTAIIDRYQRGNKRIVETNISTYD